MISKDTCPVCPSLKMLESVVQFVCRSGASEFAIRESFEKGMAGFSKELHGLHSKKREIFPFDKEDLYAELLRFWYRDSRYIDQDARPRPLTLKKGRYSIAALIRKIDSSADVPELLREMRVSGMIRRASAGKYLPTSESAVARQQRAIDRVAKLIVRLVGTVSKNVDPAGRYQPLIERSTWVHDLNPVDREAFAEFTQSQGRAYIQTMDDWLEQRRLFRTTSSRTKRSNGVLASVHTFAYLDDGGEGLSARRQAKARRMPKRLAKPRVAASSAKGSTPPREARA